MPPNSGAGDVPPHVQRLLATVAGENAKVLSKPIWNREFDKVVLKWIKLSKVMQEGSLVGGLGGARVLIASRKVGGEGSLLASANRAREVLLAGAPLIQLPSR